MKKTVIAIIALALALVAVFAFSVKYRNNKNAQENDYSSTVYTGRHTESTSAVQEDEMTLVAENKEGDYQLYYTGDGSLLVHGDMRQELKTWTWCVTHEAPTMYYFDFDKDGSKELIIRLISSVEKLENNEYLNTYVLYMFKVVKADNGTEQFKICIANADTWKPPFENAIKCEITQLSCKKYLQFTMDDIDKNISYDSNTGITQSKHAGYALAMTDLKKQYYTLDRWNKGVGIYNIDDKGNITLDIQVIANYKEATTTHYIGNIHCNIGITNNKFAIVPKTIYFIPDEKYIILDPRNTAAQSWSYTIKNTGSSKGSQGNDIDWLEAELKLDMTKDSVKESFDERSSKIKCVDSITLTESSLTLVAKEGCTFVERIAQNGAYSVTFNNGERDFDISYTCQVKTINNRSALVIDFDKTYNKKDIENILIKFGV